MKRALVGVGEAASWAVIGVAAGYWLAQLALAWWGGAIERLIR